MSLSTQQRAQSKLAQPKVVGTMPTTGQPHRHGTPPPDPDTNAAIAASAPAHDPLLAPPTGMPQAPLLRDEHPPLRPAGLPPTLLDVSPVTRRMENLDALRVVCMLAIIVTHVTEPYLDALHRRHADYAADPLAAVVLAINVMGRFGVPCFMMISFFIYWHQLYEKGRTWGELLARRMKRLIPAFLCWSTFYFAIHKILFKRYGWTFNTTSMSDFNLRHWRVWVNVFVNGQAEYHLYYLPLVMQCLLLIPLLKLLWRVPAVGWGWIGATALAWTAVVYGPVAFPAGSAANVASQKLFKVMFQPWAIPFLLFPLFGMMCAGQRPLREFLARTGNGFWIAMIVLGLALHAGEAIGLAKVIPPTDPHYLLRSAVLVKLGRLVTGFAVFALFIRQPLMRDPFPRVSHYAFGLHFMHPFIILGLSMAEWRLLGPAAHDYTHLAVPIMAVNLLLTFTITFALCLVVGRVKKLEFLVV